MNTAPPIELRFEVEEFYNREAWLLDHDELEQWLELLTDDVRYWAPVRRNLPRGTENLREPFLTPQFDDNKEGLKFRVARSRTGMAFIEEVTRVRRFVSNVRVLEWTATSVLATSNFQVFRSRQDEQWFVGCREDKLVRTSSEGLRLQERMIVLDHGVIDSITVYI